MYQTKKNIFAGDIQTLDHSARILDTTPDYAIPAMVHCEFTLKNCGTNSLFVLVK
jgi:hypothetical protein